MYPPLEWAGERGMIAICVSPATLSVAEARGQGSSPTGRTVMRQSGGSLKVIFALVIWVLMGRLGVMRVSMGADPTPQGYRLPGPWRIIGGCAGAE